jgi:hypothetical protein
MQGASCVCRRVEVMGGVIAEWLGLHKLAYGVRFSE